MTDPSPNFVVSINIEDKKNKNKENDATNEICKFFN